MKIQLKITLLFTLLCLSVIVLLSTAVYFFANEKAFEDFYTRLELRAVIASKISFDINSESQDAIENLRKQHVQRLPDEEEFIIRTDTIGNLKNTPLYKKAGKDFFDDALQHGKAVARRRFNFFAGIVHKAPSGEYLIIVTAINSYAQNFLLNLQRILVISCIIATIVLFTVGLLFSKQVLLPIRNIAKRVTNISVTSLHQRLDAGDGKDEISFLAATFNDMLSRLETAFETQNNFVSNASHELNTPLTTILGEADFALVKQRTPEQYRESLMAIMMEAEKLKAIISGLLELAQSSFNGNLVFEQVSVDELVHNCLQVAAKVYPDCNVRLDGSFTPEANHRVYVRGNAQLFELAISNVLLNACKYSNNKPVAFAIGASKTHAVFVISDQGIGIPEADIKHIYDPFFRASNVKNTKGYGIGLPLARNIVHLYKGSIDVHSRENAGTEVIIKFPL